MKKALLFAIAAFGFIAVTSCEPEETIDWDKVTVDGFYVAGPATGSDDIKNECVMAAGFNEDTKEVRDGMYEKYIVLEADKDFFLLYNDGGKKERYSAALSEFVTPLEEAYDNNPEKVMKGTLVTGNDAPAMKVAKTGLYHIVLDINKAGDLKEPQIVLLDASDFGVRGAMNGWGFTSSDPKPEFSNEGTTFTFKDQEMPKGGEFKFATGNYWKVTLDDAGKVKAEVSLAEGMTLNGANLKVDKAGKYDITLTFKLAQGSFDKNFSYTAVCTEESKLPEEMYMIGEGIAGWGLEDNPSQAVAMHPFHSQPGMFWAIRYIEAGKEFKFSQNNTKWGADFTDLGNGTGFTVANGNCSVAESGLYTLQVDMVNSRVIVEPAVIVGMADPFGNPNWSIELEAARFTIDGKLAYFTTVGAGDQIRTCVSCTLNQDWWHAEFIPKDGGIVYREGGGDPEKVAVTPGLKITYDFNAGTSSVEEAAVSSGISTPEALLSWLANPTTDAKLDADIDLSGKEIPAAEATGNFDGNGHTITVSNLAVPVIAVAKGEVKNVTFAGSFAGTPGESKFVLAPIGKSYGPVENVINKASVTVSGPAAYDAEQNGGALVAGVVGEVYGALKGCKNEGKIAVDASGKDTGSIIVAGVASVAGAAVEGCENSGEVSLVAGSPLGRTKGLTEVSMKYAPVSSVAGVVTYAVSDADHAVTVTNCNNNGKVSFTYDNLHENSAEVSRSAVTGVVANSGGDITNCNNTGAIYAKMVAADRSVAYNAKNIILHASGVQGIDYFVKKIKSAVDQNETSVINCTNSGNIYVDSDLTKSNNTAGGVSAWPSAEDAKAVNTIIKDCVNSGNIEIKGLLLIRCGGIAGGTNSIENCKNTGNITVEGCSDKSAFGLINGFHTQLHTLKNCEASGKLECKADISANGQTGGIGGLIGGLGNVANTVCEGCKVNATIVGTEKTQAGLILGFFNGNSKAINVGTTESPVTVAGSVNGVAATADNYQTLLFNSYYYKEETHVVTAVFGN